MLPYYPTALHLRKSFANRVTWLAPERNLLQTGSALAVLSLKMTRQRSRERCTSAHEGHCSLPSPSRNELTRRCVIQGKKMIIIQCTLSALDLKSGKGLKGIKTRLGRRKQDGNVIKKKGEINKSDQDDQNYWQTAFQSGGEKIQKFQTSSQTTSNVDHKDLQIYFSPTFEQEFLKCHVYWDQKSGLLNRQICKRGTFELKRLRCAGIF